jgi:hypothetical protein
VPTLLHGYGSSGAFQETNVSWDRPSVPSGPALGDSRANRPTGGKPDWYRIISDQDNKSGAKAKHYGGSSEDEVSFNCLIVTRVHK